jgi:hypothetical protein
MLWHIGLGDPRSLNSDPIAPPSSSEKTKSPPKLLGQYTFPFSLAVDSHISYILPQEIASKAGDDGTPKMYALPPTFSDTGADFSIQYHILVFIQRRGIFAVDTRYVPTVFAMNY